MQDTQQLWDSVKEQGWFISTNDKVCQKYDKGHLLMYLKGPYASPSRLIRVPYSNEFEVKRLARAEEVKSKIAEEARRCRQPQDFVFVAQEFENPSVVFDRFEKDFFEYIMSKVRYNQSKAAQLLGISRGTLRTKLEKYHGTKFIGHRGE